MEVDVSNRLKVLLQDHGSTAENLIGHWIEVVRQRNEEREAVKAAKMVREAKAEAKRKTELEVELAKERLRQISLEAREAVNHRKHDHENKMKEAFHMRGSTSYVKPQLDLRRRCKVCDAPGVSQSSMCPNNSFYVILCKIKNTFK